MAVLDAAGEALVDGIADGLYVPKINAIQFGAFGFVVGAAVGAGVAWFIAERHLRLKYEAMAEEEIDQMREHFRRQMVAREKKPDLGDVGKVIEAARYATPAPDEVIVEEADPPRAVKPPVAVRNVFDERVNSEQDPDQDWDFEFEHAHRTNEYPYVIHASERGEHGHAMLQLTYYEMDDVVCKSDENSTIIEDRDLVFGGDEMLDKFGHGSGDRNTVYIRNVSLETEIEIVKVDHVSYGEDVHGLRHSDNDRSRRRHGRGYVQE